jgi:hypothetical protein
MRWKERAQRGLQNGMHSRLRLAELTELAQASFSDDPCLPRCILAVNLWLRGHPSPILGSRALRAVNKVEAKLELF